MWSFVFLFFDGFPWCCFVLKLFLCFGFFISTINIIRGMCIRLIVYIS